MPGMTTITAHQRLQLDGHSFPNNNLPAPAAREDSSDGTDGQARDIGLQRDCRFRDLCFFLQLPGPHDACAIPAMTYRPSAVNTTACNIFLPAAKQ